MTPEIVAAWTALDPRRRDLSYLPSTQGDAARRLTDLGADRVAEMDRGGLDVAVLSVTTPGVHNLDPADAVALARSSNDVMADAIRARPDRFQGWATLATPQPEAAARELERAVTQLGFVGGMLFGRTGENNIDSPALSPVFEAAAALRVPLYLHPQSPLPALRSAYYSGFGDPVDSAFATHGIGWHYETGVQTLRMILSGVFDRFPDLQVVIGYWGELVLFYLERMEHVATAARLKRSLADYARQNLFITPSGMWSQRYLRWAVETVGPERILLATDYPFESVPDGGVRRFLQAADLDETQREAIARGNWARLLTKR